MRVIHGFWFYSALLTFIAAIDGTWLITKFDCNVKVS